MDCRSRCISPTPSDGGGPPGWHQGALLESPERQRRSRPLEPIDSGRPGGIAPELGLPAPADLRYTLTATDDCVVARLGVQALRSDRKERELAREGGSLLVCLNRTPDDRGERLRWRLALDGTKKSV